MTPLFKKPSAWIPIAIPLIFFAYLIIRITLFGIIREEDEGTGAHLFQLWLVLEPFMIGFFAVKYVFSRSKSAPRSCRCLLCSLSDYNFFAFASFFFIPARISFLMRERGRGLPRGKRTVAAKVS